MTQGKYYRALAYTWLRLWLCLRGRKGYETKMETSMSIKLIGVQALGGVLDVRWRRFKRWETRRALRLVQQFPNTRGVFPGKRRNLTTHFPHREPWLTVCRSLPGPLFHPAVTDRNPALLSGTGCGSAHSQGEHRGVELHQPSPGWHRLCQLCGESGCLVETL